MDLPEPERPITPSFTPLRSLRTSRFLRSNASLTKLRENPSLEFLASIFQDNNLPLLQEYFYEDYEKIETTFEQLENFTLCNKTRNTDALELMTLSAKRSLGKVITVKNYKGRNHEPNHLGYLRTDL